MRLLLTGGSGFIGAHTVAPLRAAGFEVHAAGRRPVAGATHHEADLLDPVAVRQVAATVQATHLLHLAWYVEPGQYWRSPRNLDWVAASLHLVRAFAEAGGRRVVAAGTCAEYAWGPPRLAEDAALAPGTLYGASKDALRRVLEAFGRDCGLSCAWGRVFYLYGPGEPAGRLVGDAIRVLSEGGRLATTHGRQRRDFMHVADVAGAFAALVASEVVGAVNIGSGRAVPVRTVLEAVAAQTGGADRIDFGARALAESEPESVEADAGRLHDEVGFASRRGLVDGIVDTVRWWDVKLEGTFHADETRSVDGDVDCAGHAGPGAAEAAPDRTDQPPRL